MIKVTSKGNFNKTEKFLSKITKEDYTKVLDKYGKLGVEALSSYTPKDTGLTSESWSYEIVSNKETIKIVFKNSNIHNNVPIAVILQYGHATGNGGWVEGIDYINPAIRPIFEKILKETWEGVTSE